jgi:hypothetical protein
MSAEKAESHLMVGDRVKIPLSGFKKGRVVEVRGPLGPGGKQVYRVRVRRKPSPVDIELTEDQIVLIPPEE